MNAVVECARSWVGTQFHHQGRTKKIGTFPGGVDCIGLVMGVAKELGIRSKHYDSSGDRRLLADLDRTDYAMEPNGKLLQYYMELHLMPVAYHQMQPGDIMLFRMNKHPQHAAFFSDIPSGQGMIHAYMRNRQVVEHSLNSTWIKLIEGVYRFCS